MEKILQRYEQSKNTEGDINQHLETIKKYSEFCSHITEVGVRNVVSTWAFLAGSPKKLISYDINESNNIQEVYDICKEYGIEFKFIKNDILKEELEQTDLLFIDTLHTYSQLKQELNKHGNKSNKYIILHDTHTFGYTGEDGKTPGLKQAVNEFLSNNSHWEVAEVFSHNNGLTCLVRKI